MQKEKSASNERLDDDCRKRPNVLRRHKRENQQVEESIQHGNSGFIGGLVLFYQGC
jgi:hypothetical protein